MRIHVTFTPSIMIPIPMQKQPTREKAVEVARKLLAATCGEYNLHVGKLVYHNDKVQYIGEVNLQVSLVYQTVTTHDFHSGDVVEVDNNGTKRYGTVYAIEHVTQALSIIFPGKLYGTFLLADNLISVISRHDPMVQGKGRW